MSGSRAILHSQSEKTKGKNSGIERLKLMRLGDECVQDARDDDHSGHSYY